MSFKPNDDSWVRTKTDRYLYAADKLNQAVRELGAQPKPADYRMILGELIPATKEQLVVFRRLRLELGSRKFPWDLPGFVKDPSQFLNTVYHSLAAGESWEMMGRNEEAAASVFKTVSDAFLMLLDCNALMRKDMGWLPPHMEDPPTSAPGGPQGPMGPPPVPIYPAG